MLPNRLKTDHVDDLNGLTPEQRFNKELDEWGELHLYHDDEAYHVHRHDTRANDGRVCIRSKRGDWTLPLDEVHVEYPHSHKET